MSMLVDPQWRPDEGIIVRQNAAMTCDIRMFGQPPVFAQRERSRLSKQGYDVQWFGLRNWRGRFDVIEVMLPVLALTAAT